MGSARQPGSSGTGESQSPRRILYPVFEELSDATFETALQVAAGVGGRFVVLDLVGPTQSVPAETRTIAGTVLEARLDDIDHVDTSYHVESTQDPVAALAEYARRHAVSLVVFDEHVPRGPTDLVYGSVPARIGSRVSCDVVTVTDGQPTRRMASILVPLTESPHAGLAASVAGAIARDTGAALDLFHVMQPGPDQDHERLQTLFQEARRQVPADVDVDTWALTAPTVDEAILNQTQHYDLTVVGWSQHGRLRRLLAGSLSATVRAEARNRVLTVRRAENGGIES